jgi:hypothetical protein
MADISISKFCCASIFLNACEVIVKLLWCTRMQGTAAGAPSKPTFPAGANSVMHIYRCANSLEMDPQKREQREGDEGRETKTKSGRKQMPAKKL